MPYLKLLLRIFITFLLFRLAGFEQAGFASVPLASQQMSGQERARQLQEENDNLQSLIEQPKTKATAQENTTPEAKTEGASTQKVHIQKILVIGVTLFPDNVINAITNPYENKDLSFEEMKKIAYQITILYRKKGFIISRAYIPPQKMEGGMLEIRVLESRVGDIILKGNRYYSTKLIESYLTFKKGDFFNYNDLKEDLNNINDHPDRSVKSVLAPGEEPGTTDIILNEKDFLPIHVELGYNNNLSPYLGSNIYSSNFIDNNLLGHDDILSFEYERGEANAYYEYSTHYLYPLTTSLSLGVYASHSKEVLGGQFSDVNSRGTSSTYGFYGSEKLVQNDSLTSHFNFGFDYLDNYNFLEGTLSSEDRLRVPRAGVDFDFSDDYGRTYISDDLNYGVPDIMGGTKAHLEPGDIPSSRAGAGGEFTKDTLNILRLQNLIFDSTLLWKNQLQFSPSKLTSSEQFQMGGPANNRGYSLAESVGDQGYAMSWDLAEPLYFVPKYWNLSYTRARVYDSIRFIEFYDWSNAHLNAIQPGEVKNTTLSSIGCGLRVDILKNLSASYQIGWPLMGKPSDGKDVHQWFEMSLKY